MKNQITITLAQIKEYSPSASVWSRVLKANGGEDADLNKPFPVSSILDSNGLDDTLEVLRCLPEYNVLWRKFAWWCAVQVVGFANDDRVSRCLEVVKRYNEGSATDEELAAANAAVWSAAEAAEGAVAEAEAWSAEWSAASAAVDAAEAAEAAEAAVWSAVWSAAAWSAGLAAEAAQEIKLREILDSGTWRD